MGEPEVVVGTVGHPGGQGVAFLLQRAAAGGVQGDPASATSRNQRLCFSRTSASMV
jgi:hypothetical protein